MKLSKELLSVIRATCKASKQAAASYSYYEEERKNVALFLKGNAKARKVVRKMRQLRSQMSLLNKQVEFLAGIYGLSSDGTRLAYGDDAKKRFVRHGGVLPPPKTATRADNVIAKLAAATDAEGQKILTELGIKW